MTDTEKQQKRLDPVAESILDLLDDGSQKSFPELAKAIYTPRKKQSDRPDAWRKYLQAVKQQVLWLARNDKVEIMRKGEVADPNDFKGLVKVRLKK